MSEHSNETDHVTPSVEPDAKDASGPSSQQTSEKSCCTRGSCCKPHTSTIIALLALILAGYAAYTASSGKDDSAIEAHLSNLDQQITALSEQISGLSEEVKTNRENLIQTKLKKALQNVQEIGNLAGEGTKAAIHEVENMLKTLTSISNQLTTPTETESTATDSTAPADEPATEPTTAPAAEPAAEPEASTPTETTQPAPAATPKPASPAASPTDNSAADQTPATVPSHSSDIPASSSTGSATNDQTATTTLPAETTPAAEPSAPQAF